jgi:hypothetical protein
MADITIEAVGQIVGENFTLKKFPNGNIQVMIKDLGSKGAYDQCKLLTATAEKLVQAGFITDPNDAIRLSWNTGKKDGDGNDIWRPYPQIWVNKPSAQSEELSNVKAELANLTGMFTQLMSAMGQQAAPAHVQEAPKP